MTRRGWHMGDLALLGLLDPRQGPARERWAVRRGEFERLQEVLNPADAVPLVQDKRLFEEACRERGLPTPPVLAVLERGADRDATVRAWWRALVNHSPPELVIKPVSGQRGIGVRILQRIPGGVNDLRRHHAHLGGARARARGRARSDLPPAAAGALPPGAARAERPGRPPDRAHRDPAGRRGRARRSSTPCCGSPSATR